MKIFLVTRTDHINYDTYDSFVCAAEDENAAVAMHPDGETEALTEAYVGVRDMEWPFKSPKKVELLGEYYLNEPRIICASFNAG